jgi:hypothetical protein
MKKMIFSGVLQILVECWSLLYSIWSVTEWGYYRNFEGFPPILILAVLGNIVKHKVTQFYTAPTTIRVPKESLDYVQKIPVGQPKVMVLWVNHK